METFEDGLGELPEPVDPVAQAALAEAEGWLGGPVFGIGLGETEDGQPCVVVLARPGADVPHTAAGLPVLVQTSDPICAQEEQTGPEIADD